MREPGADDDQRQPPLADLVCRRTQRGHVLGRKVLHLVEEQRDPAAGVAGETGEIREELDEVDLDVAGVRAPRDQRDVDPGLPALGHPSRAPARARAKRERLEHPQHVPHAVVAAGHAELANGQVQGRGQGTAQRTGRAGLELAGPPPAPDGGRAHRVEQDRLADAPQAGEDHASLRPPAGDPLEGDLERLQLLIAPGQLRRPLPGPRSVGIAHRIHPNDAIRLSSAPG